MMELSQKHQFPRNNTTYPIRDLRRAEREVTEVGRQHVLIAFEVKPELEFY